MTGPERPGVAALLVCGSLVRQVQAIVRERGWQVGIHALSGRLDLYPDHLIEAVEQKLGELHGAYEKVVVVYGDCRAGGRLDAVLERFGATRSVGLRCYEMLAGDEYARITEAEPGTYFLTPCAAWALTSTRT
jgi:hypothetical protein